jgi:hypothetical protein
VPLQFNTGFRRSGDDELEVESDDEFADIISQALECLQQQEYLGGGGGMGAGEEESVLTIVKEVRVHCRSPYCRSHAHRLLHIHRSWDLGRPPRTHSPPTT